MSKKKSKDWQSRMKEKKNYLLLGIIFITFIFLHLYQFESRMSFGWDQVDNAWAAQQILVAHDYPLLGMVAKGNTGFNIGPAYYYFVAPFYALFNMSPIASGVVAFTTSILTFFVVFFITKKLFSTQIALIAAGINTFSAFILATDRTQWPVNFIIPISFLIFYTLYKVISGKSKYLIPLSLLLGASLHIHFTSVFYFIAVALSLPLFPRNKETLKYIALSIPLFALWLIPTIWVITTEGNIQGSSLQSYLAHNYHGIHLRRIIQLIHDAMIEFNLILRFPYTDYLGILLTAVFGILYYRTKRGKRRLKLLYLTALWFAIPWLVFSTYRGEITNYYFYMTRPIVLFILAYLTYRFFTINNVVPKLLISLFWVYFAITNLQSFFQVSRDFKIDCTIHQDSGAERVNTPTSYLNYYCTHHYRK